MRRNWNPSGWVVAMVANGHIVSEVYAGFVMEPSVCGQLLGEVSDLDMRQYTVVRRLSQTEFDALSRHDEDGLRGWVDLDAT